MVNRSLHRSHSRLRRIIFPSSERRESMTFVSRFWHRIHRILISAYFEYYRYILSNFFGMSILKEFREFAIKGNVIDLAVGVIIGTAFGKVVTSIVEDIMMPPLGWVIGNINFSDLKLALPSIIEWQKAVTINYGNFFQIVLNFLIVAMAVFFLVRVINRIKRTEEKKEAKIEEVKAEVAPDILLLQEIRDLLKTKPTTK